MPGSHENADDAVLAIVGEKSFGTTTAVARCRTYVEQLSFWIWALVAVTVAALLTAA
jgi:hypothetical protein